MDEGAALARVVLRQETLRGDARSRGVGVCHELARVGERESHRFDCVVEVVGGVVRSGTHGAAVEDVERHQGRDALPVRGALVHAHTVTVAHGQRLHERGRMLSQVLRIRLHTEAAPMDGTTRAPRPLHRERDVLLR